MIDVSKEESVLPEQMFFILIFFVAIFIIMLFSGKKIHSRGFITYCFCVCVKKTAYGNKKKVKFLVMVKKKIV